MNNFDIHNYQKHDFSFKNRRAVTIVLHKGSQLNNNMKIANYLVNCSCPTTINLIENVVTITANFNYHYLNTSVEHNCVGNVDHSQ